MSQEQVLRILITDDHPIVRQGLTAMLKRRPGMSVVAEASNGREAVDLFRQHRPDVTLMDLRMPQMDGVEAIALIREEFCDARIIILTTYNTDEDIYRGLRVGAMAYLLKDAPLEELISAIQAVHAGQKCIPPEVAAKLINRMNSVELTARELQVLRLIVTGQSNKEIGSALNISEGTVRAHVNNILSKMGATDRTQAATLAIKRGLIRF